MFLPQNIIRKVIGKKFVYKFVSFPEILKMDPALVESGRCKEEGVFVSEAKDGGVRNQYLHSGLYSSLQQSLEEHQPIKMEPRSDLADDGCSVIRFKTDYGHSSLPPTPSPSSETSSSSRPPSEHPQSSPCPSSPPQSPVHTQHAHLARQSHTPQTVDTEPSSEPLNLSSGQRDRVGPRSSTTPQRRGLPHASPLRSRKPKALEISATSLFLSGSDLVSIALNSPALPSGSVTPAFLTTQVRNKRSSLTFTSITYRSQSFFLFDVERKNWPRFLCK